MVPKNISTAFQVHFYCFDKKKLTLIVQETNRYSEDFIHAIRNWQPMTGEGTLCCPWSYDTYAEAHSEELLSYRCSSKTLNLTYRFDLVKALIPTHRPQIPSPAAPRWLHVNPPPGTLFGKHIIEKIPHTGKKAKPQRKCAVRTVQMKKKMK
jgi:hypothetical protein